MKSLSIVENDYAPENLRKMRKHNSVHFEPVNGGNLNILDEPILNKELQNNERQLNKKVSLPNI